MKNDGYFAFFLHISHILYSSPRAPWNNEQTCSKDSDYPCRHDKLEIHIQYRN